MEVIILPSSREIAESVADIFQELLERKPTAALGVATGSSPLAIYDELARRHDEESLSFAAAKAFMLDEYVGLPPDHPEVYRNVIEREIASRVNFAPGAVQGPDGGAADLPEACATFEEAIRDAGGVDLQLLGIGTDGHIAFNEPGSSLASRTRMKTLTETTRSDNARFFDSPDQVPHHVLTQGLGTIMDAKRIVMVATGVGKAGAIAQAVEGPVTAFFPASILQHHPLVTVFIDDAAASQLRLADYYRYAHAHKPKAD